MPWYLLLELLPSLESDDFKLKELIEATTFAWDLSTIAVHLLGILYSALIGWEVFFGAKDVSINSLTVYNAVTQA